MSEPVEYRGDMAGFWEWLSDHGYCLSVDLYTDDATTEPGVWVATAMEPGEWSDDEDVTHRGEPAETPAMALKSLWASMRGEVLR